MENIIVFHGIDYKVGTTMLAQSVAQIIADNYQNLSVLFATLNGRKSCEYIRKSVKTVDEYKLQIDSRIFLNKEFSKECKYKENLHVLGGLVAEQEERYYHPDSIRYLLDSVNEQFDLVIVDSGNSIDNGLAIGALESGNKNYIVLGQQETSISRYEKNCQMINSLGVNFDGFIINKYIESDLYSRKYFEKRLNVDRKLVKTVAYVDLWREAEHENKTFVEMKNQRYSDDVYKISEEILRDTGLSSESRKKRGIIWKNFM